jgi:predicted MPP superfamily phosphohydrolase
MDLAGEKEGYTLLLSHRPERFGEYVASGVDLVFSGHAHGGQARLPFIGGVIAPHQGFFPEYDAGVFTEGDCSMVVSRGLGASIIPLRIGNRPELVVAQLHRQEA